MGYGAINIVKSKEEGNKFNYFLVYFLFAFGGVTTFSSNSRFVQGFFILLAVIFFFKKAVIDKEFLIILFFVFIIYIVQGYVIDDITLKGALVLFYTFFIPYSIIKLVGKKFTDYYIRITYLFSIISFFFLIPSYYSQDFREAVRHFAIWINLDPLEGVTENFIIYNYESMTDGLIKNPGPFYEAGAFGTFLIIALLLNLIKTKNIFEKKNIIFVVTILSTLSTAAYISLFCLLFFYLMEKKSIWMNMVIAPIFVAIVFVMFFH